MSESQTPAAVLRIAKSAIRQHQSIMMADDEPLSYSAARQHWDFICSDTLRGCGTWQAGAGA